MKKQSKTTPNSGIKLVFFGSGPVSAASLASLSKGFDIEAVITKPSTAKEMAACAPDVPLHTVNNRGELSRLFDSKKFTSQLGVVVDFGIIISSDVIGHFHLGIVNSHFSLLPRWRGADPISFAILHGDEQTGVSLMLIDEGLDTGDLLAQQSLDIPPSCTTPELTEKLIVLSNRMMAKTLPRYTGGLVRPYPQPNPTQATYSRKLTKADGLIDWNKPAIQIERQIRAFAGWPRSTAKIGEHSLIISSAKVLDKTGKPGNYEAHKGKLLVFCSRGALDILSVQPPGKKQMPISAFLAGHKL